MNALTANQTLELVSRSPKMNLVGCSWIFKTKIKSNGELDCLKARLMAKGYINRKGLTLSKVWIRLSNRLVFGLYTVSQLWKDDPLDSLMSKMLFCMGTYINQYIYGAATKLCWSITHVCKLTRALYSLKQAPRAWFEWFRKFLFGFRFFCSTADSSLFVCRHSDGLLILLLYVDGIVLIGDNPILLKSFIITLAKEFPMTDLGPLHFFLGSGSAHEW